MKWHCRAILLYYRKKCSRCNLTLLNCWDTGYREYERGFGSVYGEHWLGLDNMRWLTHGRMYSLKVILEDWTGRQRYALYDKFMVFGQHYLLAVSKYTKFCTANIRESVKRQFSTSFSAAAHDAIPTAKTAQRRHVIGSSCHWTRIGQRNCAVIDGAHTPAAPNCKSFTWTQHTFICQARKRTGCALVF